LSAQRSKGTYARIYAVVRRIPRGRVATYGQVARLAGMPGHARQVGYALNALPAGSRLPWQRVVNAEGGISPRSRPGCDDGQRALLEEEGVEFDERGRIALSRYRWSPRERAASRRSELAGRGEGRRGRWAGS
jgi:methylated-DNA-protein-cysteine methyltransferase-like protein